MARCRHACTHTAPLWLLLALLAADRGATACLVILPHPPSHRHPSPLLQAGMQACYVQRGSESYPPFLPKQPQMVIPTFESLVRAVLGPQ